MKAMISTCLHLMLPRRLALENSRSLKGSEYTVHIPSKAALKGGRRAGTRNRTLFSKYIC